MKGLVVIAAVAGCLAPASLADPCEAKLPTKAGTTFSGTVKYVGDGDSLCIGKSSDGAEWIEVRLADFDAPELGTKDGKTAKAIFEKAALGRSATCTVTKGRSGNTTTYDRVIAVCRVGGSSIGDLLRRAGTPAGGN